MRGCEIPSLIIEAGRAPKTGIQSKAFLQISSTLAQGHAPPSSPRNPFPPAAVVSRNLLRHRSDIFSCFNFFLSSLLAEEPSSPSIGSFLTSFLRLARSYSDQLDSPFAASFHSLGGFRARFVRKVRRTSHSTTPPASKFTFSHSSSAPLVHPPLLLLKSSPR